MKSFMRSLLNKIRCWLWALLGSALIGAILISPPAFAAETIEFGDTCNPSGPKIPINAVIEQPITPPAENITLDSPSGDVFWTFTGDISTGCDDSDPRHITCAVDPTDPISGITVTLPDPDPPVLDDPSTPTINESVVVGPSEPVIVAGTASTPGAFNFSVQVRSVDNFSNSGCEDFQIVVSQPFEVSFVLDRSGSMNTTGDDASNPTLTRWQALTAGVESFVNILVSGDSTASPALSPAAEGSQLGLTLFNGNALVNSSLPGSFPDSLVDIDANLITSGNSLNVGEILARQAPGGWTSIGSGLETGLAKFSNPTYPNLVILFSDGDQNRPRFVTSDGVNTSDDEAGLSNLQSIASFAGDSGTVKISTVGVNSPDVSYLQLLEDIANAHDDGDGHSLVTTSGDTFLVDDNATCSGTIQEAFTCVVVDALSDNSPLFVAHYSGSLQSEPVKLPEFDINQNLRLLMINFSFSRKLERPETEAVLDGVHIYKNGTDITRYFQRQIANNYTGSAILKTDFALRDENQNIADLIASEGRYLIKLNKPSNIKDFDYRISPIADDARLHVKWGVQPNSRRVFESIRPIVNLSWRDQPIKGARVYAHVLTPGDDLGDLLARNNTFAKPDQDRQDPNSPGYQKYLFLLENDPEFVERLALKDNRVELTDPDGDGSYEASFSLDDISGEYQIMYQIFAKDPQFGSPIQRLLFESIYTRFGEIDLNASAISNTVDANGHPTITWRPTTTYGRFIGPANASAIEIQGSQEVSIEDRQDGSYVMSLGDIRPESKISISMLGEEVYRGTACQFGKPEFDDIDLNASKISTKVDTNGIATIDWYPRTVRQKLIGANQAKFIDIQGAQKTDIRDNKDGSYTMTLVGVEPDSKIAINLSCKEVYRGSISEFGKQQPTVCRAWWCRMRDWWQGRLSGGTVTLR